MIVCAGAIVHTLDVIALLVDCVDICFGSNQELRQKHVVSRCRSEQTHMSVPLQFFEPHNDGTEESDIADSLPM